jgi:ribose 5-phosphate isomerase B
LTPSRRRRLITERDVLRAARAGERTLDAANAAVTPSARDAARRAGIALAPDDSTPRDPEPATLAESGPEAGSAPVAMSPSRRIALGADHGGVSLKDAILADLRAKGHEVHDVGTFGTEAVDYPDFALAVAREVADGRADVGIMIDGAGIGSCMAANKVRGVRAAMCYDVTTSANAREHNNANVLTLGGTLIGTRLALEIVSVFVSTPFAGGRHARRVDKIDRLDSA